MSRRFFAWTLGLAALSLVVSAALSAPVAGVSHLWPEGLPPNPYFIPGQALLLYVAVPLFAAAAVGMLVAPGVLTVIAWDGDRPASWGSVLSRGFLLAYVGRTGLHSLVKLLGGSLGPGVFWTGEVVLLLAAAVAFAVRWRAGALVCPTGPLRRVALLAAVPAALALLLLPQLFWQDFTEDGLEALEIGWSLNQFVVPRFPNDTGFMGLGIGMLSMAPPVSWFIQLLGPTEAAARLPLVLYLPLAAVVIMSLAEVGRRRLGPLEGGIVLAALAAYVAIMGFSATYDRYAADFSAPTAFETLTLLCLSAGLLALWERRTPTFLAFVALGYLARPTALMLVLLLGVSTLVVMGGDDRRRMLRDVAFALGVCVAAIVLYEKIYLDWASGGAMSYEADSVLHRYRYLRLFDARRFLWVMIPGGFLPFLSLFAWRRQDPLSRQLSVVLVLYFLSFFFPAFVALHHFVPVMVLPVVVLLRLAPDAAPRGFTRVAFGSAVVGLALSLPWHYHVDRSSRELGSRFAFEVGQYGYETSPAEHRAALDSRGAVFQLFPATWDVPDASVRRVGAALPFLHYSWRSGSALQHADYAIVPESEQAPGGFLEVGRARGAVAYARDPDQWEADLAAPPPVEFGNPIFVLPPETLFSFVGAPAGAYDVDLGSLPVIWRLF